MYKKFDLAGHGTTLRTEGIAGLSNFFTVVYIVAVNSAILADRGIPLEAGILAAGIASGGKTDLTAVTTGVLFLLSLLFLPFIKLIPASVIAPVLIVIGGLMITNVQKIPFHDFSEWFPAFLVIALIPLTYSIADGIAFGFLAYPVLKIALGRSREVATPLFVIAGLFLVNFVLHTIG